MIFLGFLYDFMSGNIWALDSAHRTSLFFVEPSFPGVLNAAF